MNDDAILSALQTAIIAAVAASNMPDLPIKSVGRTEMPPNSQKYLEIVWIPNNRENDFWGEEKNYQGMMRLILHWPNNDEGAYPPLAVLKSIAVHFPKDRLISGVQIYTKPNLMQPLEEPAETLYPLSLRYRSFRAS